MMRFRLSLLIVYLLLFGTWGSATDYYFSAAMGNDDNSGLSAGMPMKSLAKASSLKLQPGDRLLLAAGESFFGTLVFQNINGTAEHPILVTSYHTKNVLPAAVDFKIDAIGEANGILLENCSYVYISHAEIEANGFVGARNEEQLMRVGVLITTSNGGHSSNIFLDSLHIHDVYFEQPGFVRGMEEVKTANGTQRYGWGIRLISNEASSQIHHVTIRNSAIENVSHTGIKFSGQQKNIHDIDVCNNDVSFTGGPGMQMSEVKKVHVHQNSVDHSGSNNDTRKWGRGSGLWTWSSSEILIEHNRFTNANGPGDSAGAHIDYNCDNVVLQYNFSAWNAGGFCEILGNNYNCAYRYNISVNDGSRIKGKNGAFQEGKIFWLSGYQGDKKPRKGPVNSYFYNNTIYVDSSITARIAIDATSSGILIANNIFFIAGKSQSVLGDQYKADDGSGTLGGPVVFANNLWLSNNSWPADALIFDKEPQIGNPLFKTCGGLQPKDYIPQKTSLVREKGILISTLPGDNTGLLRGMNLAFDFNGNRISGRPPIGAIIPE